MSKESKTIGRGSLGIEGKRKGRVEEEQLKWEDAFFVMRRSPIVMLSNLGVVQEQFKLDAVR